MKIYSQYYRWLFAFNTLWFSGDVHSAQTLYYSTILNCLTKSAIWDSFSITRIENHNVKFNSSVNSDAQFNASTNSDAQFNFFVNSDAQFNSSANSDAQFNSSVNSDAQFNASAKSTETNTIDTSKPDVKTQTKILWKDYLNDTNWEDSDHEHNGEQDHCHKKINLKSMSIRSIQNNISINNHLYWLSQKLPFNGLFRSNFPRNQKRIDSLLQVDSIKRQNRFLTRIPAKTNFYFQSAQPLNSRQWLLQSQNFVGFRAQYGITNYLSTGVCRDYSGYWMQANIQLNAYRYKGYAATLGLHGGKFIPLNSRIWGGSLNQTFSTKWSETSVRVSTNQLYDIQDARKENLTINFAHKQRLNKTWTLIGEMAYLPGKDRKQLIVPNEWLNAEQLNQKHAMDQYTWLVGISKVMGKKTHFDFGVQAVSGLDKIYTVKEMPFRQFVERWTFILPFPFINMSITL